MNSTKLPKNQRFILLIEDDENDIELTRLALKKNQITENIVVQSNGRRALQYLNEVGNTRSYADKPSLILLDINMPEIDGIEVLKEIKQSAMLKDIPVVMLSSSDERRDISRSYNFGANSFVQKPVAFEEFVEAVKQIGKYWVNLNQTVSD